MDVITSLHNPLVKLIRSLDSKKHRRETGLFVAEGEEVLERARIKGWAPVHLLSREENGARSDARRIIVSESVMVALSGQTNPAGVLGVFRQRWSEALPSPAPRDLWIGLEDLRDPGNLGTILRTADAVAAGGVILIGRCCDPYSREAVRASMGSIFAVPLLRMEPSSFLALAGSWPGETVAAALSASEDYRRAYGSPTLLAIGSEGRGLSPALLEALGTRVRIPMPGGTESLNAAVAAALMLYEIRRPLLA